MVWQRARLGMAMLILTEAVFFFMLILAFVYFRDESLKTATATLNLRVTSLFTACLLISCFTLWRAQSGSRLSLWLGLTILFGVAFFAGQGSEYVRILRGGFTMSQGLFGTTFFTVTGVHGLHVLIGLVLLGVTAPSHAGTPKGDAGSRLSTVSMYWYFVAAVWIAIFSTVYLWSFL
jgi:heme/copper-type cytochrome/quinol oxidase subunit 3